MAGRNCYIEQSTRKWQSDNPDNLRYLYQLRVGLSTLRSHKYNHNFKDTPNDACRCGTGIESTEHFLLKCLFFTELRDELLSTINPMLSKIRNLPSIENSDMVQILLYGSQNLTLSENQLFLTAVIKYIQHTKRFIQSSFRNMIGNFSWCILQSLRALCYFFVLCTSELMG